MNGNYLKIHFYPYDIYPIIPCIDSNEFDLEESLILFDEKPYHTNIIVFESNKLQHVEFRSYHKHCIITNINRFNIGLVGDVINQLKSDSCNTFTLKQVYNDYLSSISDTYMIYTENGFL